MALAGDRIDPSLALIVRDARAKDNVSAALAGFGGVSKRLDMQLIEWDAFRAKRDSVRDVEHWPYENCRILLDIDGSIVSQVLAIVCMDRELRLRRIKLHFFEFAYYARRFNKLGVRTSELNRRAAAAKALESFVKAVFLCRGKWPPLAHWTEEQLRLVGIPPESIDLVHAFIQRPERDAGLALEAMLLAHITGHDAKTWRDDEELVQQVTAGEFRSTRERYSVF